MNFTCLNNKNFSNCLPIVIGIAIGITYACSSLTSVDTVENKTLREEVVPFDIKKEEVISVLNQFQDSLRKRNIAIENTFLPDIHYIGWVIFSHGYGNNKGDTYLKYSYITHGLAKRGYFVTSIQHEMENDPILPMKGDMQLLRAPFWIRGSDNIHFVKEQLLKKDYFLNSIPIILIGHSNGGDISARYSLRNTNEIDKLVTLDNLRHSLTNVACKGILTLRSQDRETDKEVFENWENRKTQYAQIVKLPVNHSDMSDRGTEEQKMQILRSILDFLQAN